MSLATLVTAVVFSLAACGGGGADVKSEINTTTMGQQLMDLKKAVETGAMTQAEYDVERAKVLNAK